MVDQFQPFLLIVGDDHVIKINYLSAEVTQVQIEFFAASFAQAKRKHPVWFSSQPKFQYFELKTVSRKPAFLVGFDSYLADGERVLFWCEELEEYLEFSELNLEVLIQILFEYLSRKDSKEDVDILSLHALLIEKDDALMADAFSDDSFDEDLQIEDYEGDPEFVSLEEFDPDLEMWGIESLDLEESNS